MVDPSDRPPLAATEPISSSTRREFLRRSLAAAGALAFPTFIPASALGRDGFTPSERIAFGVIGLGTIGMVHVKNLAARPGARLAAICDADATRLEAAQTAAAGVRLGRLENPADPNSSATPNSAPDVPNPNAATQAPAPESKDAIAVFRDFREMLARPELDAIIVATPDHWHGVMAVAAARAGKDVYCEKPLTHTIAEGRVICDAITANGRVLQTGTWQRSIRAFRHACELVRNGRIGRVHTVKVGPGGVAEDFCWKVLPEMPVPPQFDYNMWLGPAPVEPYTEKRCHFHFRWNFDYAGGQVTDVGAHHVDIAQWGLGTEHTGPVHVESKGEVCRGALANVFKKFEITYTYASGIKMIMASDLPGAVRFEGDEGWVWSKGWDQLAAWPKSLETEIIRPDELHLMVSNDHMDNFIEAIRTRRQPIAPAETAHRNATICNLGNISLRLGRGLDWDPAAEVFPNDPEAQRLIARPMRAPWGI